MGLRANDKSPERRDALDVQMRSDVQMCRLEDVQMKTNVQMSKCADVQMSICADWFRCADAQMARNLISNA